jgi:cell division protein FtsL
VSPRAAAAAVARGAAATVHAPTRTRPARRPAPARRRSGGATARPSTRVATPRFDGVALLDRLLRGPAYIALVGVLLAGIVFFNVDVLETNHGIARTDTRASQLKRENAALTLKLAKLGSSERIQRVALDQGLVLPPPGDVRYLRAHRDDAGRALRVMTAPDSSSAAPAVTTLVTQQSGGASTGTPSATTQTVPTTTTTPTTTTQTQATTTTQSQPTTTTQTTPTQQTQTQQTQQTQQTAPTTTAPAAAPPTTTQGGAAAPAAQ